MDDLISIIIPVYNSSKYLNECLMSVFNQSYSNIEVLMINDGSTDKSKEICEKFEKKDKRFKVYDQKNLGVSAARNLGIEKSNGVYITFVDSDDIIDESYCLELIKKVDKNTDFVIGRTISFVNDDINNKIDDGYKGKKIENFDKSNKDKLIKSIFVDNKKLDVFPHISTCSSKLIRKKLILDNLIRYDEELSLYEDALFNIKVINFSRNIKVVDKCIYYYRFFSESSSNKFRSEMINNYSLLYKKVSEIEKKYNLNIFEYLSYFKIKNLNIILSNYYKNNSSNSIRFAREICLNKEYNDAINNIKLSILPKRRKAIVIFARLHLYRLIVFIYKLN